MAAAAFKASLIGALGSPTGPRKIIPLTFSDVNAAFGLFPSGGTDTSQMEYFINGISTGQKTLNATMLATAVSRPFQQGPFRVPAGAPLRITQLT
jgi:hypothetical protein